MIPPKLAFVFVVIGVLLLLHALYEIAFKHDDEYSPKSVYIGMGLTFGGLFLKDLK